MAWKAREEEGVEEAKEKGARGAALRVAFENVEFFSSSRFIFLVSLFFPCSLFSLYM